MCNRIKYQFEINLPKKLKYHKSAHFHIYYYPYSFAEKDIDHIAQQREKAYSDIAAYLNTDINMMIDLYLFDNADIKEKETNHKGAGWAFDTVMVEIYNELVKCHPYHELVHVFSDVIYGNTISFFSEGLAVFISENAYTHNFGDNVNYNTQEKVKHFYQTQELFTLKEMFSLQIGESVSKPKISYPQAASLIKYIYNFLGKERFFKLYRNLKDAYTYDDIIINIREFEKHFGTTVEQVNHDWLDTLLNA